jgi:uncharacterized membrane protein (UPF0127 family)
MNQRLLLISFLVLVSCSQTISSVTIDDLSIPVELAATAQQKEQGLMFRTNLSGGMLFTYENEQPRHFWMKSTLIPLDIIFIDKNMNIVTIHHAVPCEQDPCKVYSSEPAQYVLEVNANFTEENDIDVGTELSFNR